MRLFAAVDPGDEVRAAARAARRVIEAQLAAIHVNPPRLVWMADPSLHVTLRFFGEQPEARASEIVDAMRQPFAMRSFAVRWHGLGAFPSPRNPRALWIGVTDGAAELGTLEAAVARRFASPGTEGAAKPFHPHLTLGRVKIVGAAVDWPAVLEAAALAPVRSLVTDVVLYRSRGLPGGLGYEVLAKGRLEG